MRASTALLLFATIAMVGGVSGCSSKEEDAAAATAEAQANGWRAIPAVSGARLQARFLTGGGARELVGFHDAERNEDCTFQPAEGGRMRCLPETIPSLQNGGYSDAACQLPLVTLPACGGADVKYAITYRASDNGCGGQTPAEIRTLGPASATRYALAPTGCALQPASAPAATPIAALGEVVPWTAFVAAEEMVTPGDLVSEKVLVASDGARQHVGFHIDTLDADCTFQLMPDGYTRCVPEAAGGQVYYADAACTQATFVNDYQNGQCSTPLRKLWIEPAVGMCAGARAVYSLRESSGGDVAPYDTIYTPSVSFSGSGNGPATLMCSSQGSGGGYPSASRRPIEADITGSLPTTVRVIGGEGRLVPALVPSAATATSPSPSVLAPGWHDKERDADCTFTLATDGKLRCLPTGASATVFFTDTTCSSPSLVAVTGEVSCAGTARFARVATSTCPVTTRVFALGTERRNLTSASTQSGPGRCPTVAGVTNALDATEVDPAGFVEGVPGGQ